MITLTEEQAQQIEGALDLAQILLEKSYHHKTILDAYKAIRAAIAQEQEPVAWWFQPPNKNVRPMFDTQQHGGKWKPLYAAPVRTKDLTDDELFYAIGLNKTIHTMMTATEIGRAAIAADREKNK